MITDEHIKTGLIEPDALHAHLQSGNTAPHIKMLDASFVLPSSAENPYQNYNTQRIADASFFDITEIADKTSTIPHMLPSAEHFAAAMSRLGLTQDDTIVIYGQSGMVMGPARAWWMLRCFGHRNVVVLNGGLPAWRAAGYPLTTTPPTVTPDTNAVYTAAYQAHLVKSKDEILSAISTKDEGENTSLILDARAPDRFNGTSAEPRANMNTGHIPSSKNLPCMTLINQQSHKMKSTDELQSIFKDIGHTVTQDTITTCGSGVTACVIALALYTLGHKNIPVYDGSWSEWGHTEANTPITTQP